MLLEHDQVVASASSTGPEKPGRRARVGAALSGTFGTVAGVAPHVLHHVGPIASAAILTGAGGTLLFGALGFVFMVPMLLRFKRRSGTWLAPAMALAAFALMFTVSTLWIGPAIRDAMSDGDSASQTMDHTTHEGHR